MADAWMPGARCIRAQTDGGQLGGGAPRVVWLTLGADPRVISVWSAAQRLNQENRPTHLVWDPLTGDIAQLLPIVRAGCALGMPEYLDYAPDRLPTLPGGGEPRGQAVRPDRGARLLPGAVHQLPDDRAGRDPRLAGLLADPAALAGRPAGPVPAADQAPQPGAVGSRRPLRRLAGTRVRQPRPRRHRHRPAHPGGCWYRPRAARSRPIPTEPPSAWALAPRTRSGARPCRLATGLAGVPLRIVSLPDLSSTSRTALRRHRERGRTDRDDLYAVLDAGLICHLGVIADGVPRVLPTGYGRLGDTLYLHGSSANATFMAGGGQRGLRHRHAPGRAGLRPVGVQPLDELPQRHDLRRDPAAHRSGRADRGAPRHHRAPGPRAVVLRAPAHQEGAGRHLGPRAAAHRGLGQDPRRRPVRRAGGLRDRQSGRAWCRSRCGSANRSPMPRCGRASPTPSTSRRRADGHARRGCSARTVRSAK